MIVEFFGENGFRLEIRRKNDYDWCLKFVDFGWFTAREDDSVADGLPSLARPSEEDDQISYV